MSNGQINWVITVILIPLVFGAYLYSYAIDNKALSVRFETEQRAQTIKTELEVQIVKAEQQALAIKVDLKEEIQRSEQRVQESIKELKALIQQRP